MAQFSRFARTVAAHAVGLACFGSANASVLTLGTLANPADYISDCTFWCVQRYQQVYDASSFAGTINLSRVSFFAAPDNGSAWNGVSSWRMTLSTTSQAVGGLDTTFNNNVGGDASVFATQTFSGTQSFGDLVSFVGAFTYDSSMGNLLVDIERVAGSAQGVGLQAISPAGGIFDRAYAFSSNVTTLGSGFANHDYGNRTQFEFDVVPQGVPEPTSLALFGLALLPLSVLYRRRALVVR